MGRVTKPAGPEEDPKVAGLNEFHWVPADWKEFGMRPQAVGGAGSPWTSVIPAGALQASTEGPAPGVGQFIFCIQGAGAALVWDGHAAYDIGMPYRQLDEKLFGQPLQTFSNWAGASMKVVRPGFILGPSCGCLSATTQPC